MLPASPRVSWVHGAAWDRCERWARRPHCRLTMDNAFYELLFLSAATSVCF